MNRSTNTMIESNLFETGSLTIASIVIELHGAVGIGRGWRSVRSVTRSLVALASLTAEDEGVNEAA